MTPVRAIAWLLLGACVLAWLFVELQGCTCVVNESSPTGHVADGGLGELDDAG